MGGGVGGGAVGGGGGGEEGVGVGVGVGVPLSSKIERDALKADLTSPHQVSKVKKSQTLDQIRDAYLTLSTRDLLLCSRCGVQIPNQTKTPSASMTYLTFSTEAWRGGNFLLCVDEMH